MVRAKRVRHSQRVQIGRHAVEHAGETYVAGAAVADVLAAVGFAAARLAETHRLPRRNGVESGHVFELVREGRHVHGLRKLVDQAAAEVRALNRVAGDGAAVVGIVNLLLNTEDILDNVFLFNNFIYNFFFPF